jgi:thiamine biosynthesis lipoprotein
MKFPAMNRIIILPALLACALLFSSCASGNAKAPATKEVSQSSYDSVDFVMGTVMNQTIYSENPGIAAAIADLLTETENERLSWRIDGSEIAEINKNAGTGIPTKISDATKNYLQAAIEVAKDSDGAFDPTIGKLSRLWGFDEDKGEIPETGDIRKLLQNVGYANIKLDGDSVSITKDLSLDLGAIGKGVGCDEIVAYLDARNDVRGALINIGGSSILTYGEKDSKEPWKVAVLNPRDESSYLGALTLVGTNYISSSGDYERYFERDGKRYHHILDPSTGFPAASGLISVTVIAGSGAESDALSTACFVLGYKKSLALLKKYGANAIFVDAEKNVYVTDGLKDAFELTAADYALLSDKDETEQL